MVELVRPSWEYLWLMVTIDNIVDSIAPHWPSEKYFSLYKGAKVKLVDLMMVLGRDGWELAAIEPAPGHRQFHFKRQQI